MGTLQNVFEIHSLLVLRTFASLNSFRSHWQNLQSIWNVESKREYLLKNNLKLGTTISLILISVISDNWNGVFTVFINVVKRISKFAKQRRSRSPSMVLLWQFLHGFRMPRLCRATLISILRRFLNSRQRWKAFHTHRPLGDPWSPGVSSKFSRAFPSFAKQLKSDTTLLQSA